MEFNLKNKVVLITGATRGIGKSTALSFLEHGSRVVVGGREKNTVTELSLDCKRRGYESLGIVVDVSDEDSVEKMFQKIFKNYGGIDVLVNNAGIGRLGKIEDMSEDDWDDVMNINLWGTFLCCQKVIPIFKKNKKGKIINIASDVGRVGCCLLDHKISPFQASGEETSSSSPGFSLSYSVSKGGVVALTKYLACTLAKYNINVNTVCPGIIKTDFLLPHKNNSVNENISMLQRIPARRLGNPEEIASLILYLASCDSDYMTGQSLSVNGGMYMNF